MTLVLWLNKRDPPFHTSIESTVACFDLLHMDIWGPFSTPSMSGHQYFLTIVDDHSKFFLDLSYAIKI